MFTLLVLMLQNLLGESWAASHSMPADQLVKLSNKQLCDKGQAHWDKNELDSALISFNIVANRADRKQSIDDMHDVCAAITAMGNIYQHRFYDYEKAMQCYLKSEKIEKKFQFNRQLAHLYYYMAALESEKNDITNDYEFCETAFELTRRAYRMSIEHDVQHTQIHSIISLAITALRYGKLDLVSHELHTFLNQQISDTIIDRDYAKFLCSAAIHASHKDYIAALTDLSKLEMALPTDTSNAINRELFIAHENRFFVYRNMGNHTAALQELDKMEKIARENDLKEGVLEVLFLKRDYYAALGNTAMADKYDLQYYKAKDQFMTEAKVAKADEEKVLFKLTEANNEIKELSYKQRIQQTELIAVAVVALLLLTLLVLAWVSHRQTKEKNRSLYEQNQQLLANIDRMRQLRQEQERREKEQQAQASEAQTASIPAAKYGRGKMEGDDIAQVMEKVERVMDESEEIFSTEFSLDRLVELTGETESRVSQAINTSGHKYYELLNEYRVREACRRMNDKAQYGGLTIEAIGQSVGFKSRSNFVSTFKRIVGLTPSAYLKQPSKTKE